ncbi:hypothetical protein N7U66_12230 [Lacinutrix neustonica]|uniref:Uncharacterized protein n=1 Tax=Lacinutrix neustonica TaxID=2980107 RepID=A0A9E8MTC2_9FLAO|nr:hypothetical protein [Lacinutrix neustonica]WAC00971.1 hypothetical protein N7U66_12230 [Lacinutrix neustonica]
MNKKIIENIVFDTKVTDNFYVIKDKEKHEINSTFISENFDNIIIEEGYNYGYATLKYKNCLLLSFGNEYEFRLDFIILDTTKEISHEIINYLSENYDDEIRSTTIDIYEYSDDF